MFVAVREPANAGMCAASPLKRVYDFGRIAAAPFPDLMRRPINSCATPIRSKA
jgi:hypothetical protein